MRQPWHWFRSRHLAPAPTINRFPYPFPLDHPIWQVFEATELLQAVHVQHLREVYARPGEDTSLHTCAQCQGLADLRAALWMFMHTHYRGQAPASAGPANRSDSTAPNNDCDNASNAC